jgi:hypothetical protein
MLTSRIITIKCGGSGLVIPKNVIGLAYRKTEVNNKSNVHTPCELFNMSVKEAKEDIFIYTHDDVTIHDPDWYSMLTGAFDTEGHVVAVGFGGAAGLGNSDLYKRPYRMNDMARVGYASNQSDWQVHGELLPYPRRVAVLDAFVMAVRRSFLEEIGGWPEKHLTHHCLDLWLACEAARHNKQIWAVPVACTHHGGGTSTKGVYANAKWLQGGTLDSDHQEPHRWLYENYRDALPILPVHHNTNFMGVE